MIFPHCHQEITTPPAYDPSDPVQKEGYDDTCAEIATGGAGKLWCSNPYRVKTSKYRRWSIGYHEALKK